MAGVTDAARGADHRGGAPHRPRHCARAGAAGYAVVLHAHRSRAEAEKLAGEIVGAGGRASVVLADLADARRCAG